MHANNAPLRGFKQQYYEGGVRVPFIVSWPDRLKGGRKCDVPVCSIDILPTALVAAGVSPPKKTVLDGKNMLPVLEGKAKHLHDHLFWSSGGLTGKWAVRSGDWKLVTVKDNTELFDLSKDIGEKTNLAKKHPATVALLTKLYAQWLDKMAEPNSRQPKRWHPGLKPRKKKNREEIRKKRREERRKKKLEARKKQKGKRSEGVTFRWRRVTVPNAPLVYPTAPATSFVVKKATIPLGLTSSPSRRSGGTSIVEFTTLGLFSSGFTMVAWCRTPSWFC